MVKYICLLGSDRTPQQNQSFERFKRLTHCLLGSDRTPQQNQFFERFKRLTHKDGSLGKIVATLGALVTFHCRSFPSRVDACAESHASKNEIYRPNEVDLVGVDSSSS